MTRLVLAAAAALALSACAAGSPDPAGTAGTTDPAPAPAPAGDFDCAIHTSPDLQEFGVAVQILAQLRGQDQVDLVQEGTLAYDSELFSSVLDRFDGLDAYAVLGKPSESVEFYRGANDLAADILAVDGPVPDDQFQAVVDYQGDFGSFLSKQTAIYAALSEACD